MADSHTYTVGVALLVVVAAVAGFGPSLTAGQTTVANQTPTEVDSCTTITEPGEYVLKTDVVNDTADTCIAIEASNVTLRGMSHVIASIENETADSGNATADSGNTTADSGNATADSGNETADSGNETTEAHAGGRATVGVAVTGTNVTLRNLTVTEWTVGLSFDDSANVTVQNATVNATDSALSATNGSTNVTGENVTFGGTTVSFAGTDFALAPVATPVPAPDGYTTVGGYVNATNTSANSSLLLAVHYSETALTATGVDEQTLGLWRYENGTWSKVTDSEVDAAQNVVTGNVTEFGVFAPVGNVTNVSVERGPSVALDCEAGEVEVRAPEEYTYGVQVAVVNVTPGGTSTDSSSTSPHTGNTTVQFSSAGAVHVFVTNASTGEVVATGFANCAPLQTPETPDGPSVALDCGAGEVEVTAPEEYTYGVQVAVVNVTPGGTSTDSSSTSPHTGNTTVQFSGDGTVYVFVTNASTGNVTATAIEECSRVEDRTVAGNESEFHDTNQQPNARRRYSM